MEKKVIEFIQYTILVVFIGISAIVFSSLYSNFQRFLVIVIVAVFYFVWGLWHHKTLGRLNKPIVLEYLLVSLLVIGIFALGMGVIRFL